MRVSRRISISSTGTRSRSHAPDVWSWLPKKSAYSVRAKALFLIPLFLLPFVNSLAINGREISLPGFMIFVPLATAMALASGSLNKIKQKLVSFFLFAIVVLLCYVLINPAPLLEQFKILALLVTATCLALAFKWDEICWALMNVARIVLVLGVGLYIFNIGVDGSYGLRRMQSLMSEPSAMALPVSIVIVHGVVRKCAFDVLLSLVCLIATLSTTAFIVTSLSLVAITMFIADNYVKRIKIFLAIILSVSFTVLIVNLIFDLRNFITFITFRIRMTIIYFQTDGSSGYSPRLENLEPVLNIFSTPFWVLGYGANAARGIDIAENLEKSYSYPFELLYSFGVIGLLLYYFVCLLVLKRETYKLGVLHVFIPLLIFSTISSAHGFALTIFQWILLIRYYLVSKTN